MKAELVKDKAYVPSPLRSALKRKRRNSVNRRNRSKSPRLSTMKRRKPLVFSSQAQVHEFNRSSPSCIRKRKVSIDKISDEEVISQLRARGIRFGPNTKISNVHRRNLKTLISKELKRILKTYHIEPLGGIRSLKEKVQLIKRLEKRAHVALIYRDSRVLPIDMSGDAIKRELKARRIVVPDAKCRSIQSPVVKRNLNDYFVSASVEKKLEKRPHELIEALENVLIKDSPGIVVDGYEFGKKIVSVEEMLYKTYEENNLEVETADRHQIATDMKNIRNSLEAVKQNVFFEALKYECRVLSVEANEAKKDSLDQNQLFNLLYKSKKWKEGYPEVVEEGESESCSCM
eukprot:maker-scaffold_22-snap-gene-5.15-mRNA-1 protein AED:0.00 eAED:0.00 QI:61/1/1/1/1/1/2/31/344